MPDPLLPEVDIDVPPDGLPIGKVAEAIGVGVEALRYYEREGLMLSATPRDAGGRRRYGERDLAWISGLVMLRETGMPISDIRVIADLSRREGTERERLEFFEAHRARVVEHLEKTQRHLAAIDQKIKSYRTALAGNRETASEGKSP
ncbi:MerR family transcriptional regulator [Streptomyces griseorubiginosus]|uniref:MerR family transcriptional regulator n=1 Tax=Streptomyces griseorubiginosus TaxID=67304 RepID=UPI003634CC03